MFARIKKIITLVNNYILEKKREYNSHVKYSSYSIRKEGGTKIKPKSKKMTI